MSIYRYSAPAQSGQPIPDADAIMDELADHALEQNSIDKAMLKLCRKGMNPKYDDSVEGLDHLASRLRNTRRQLLGQHSMDPLIKEISQQIQDLVRRELEALREKVAAEQERINQMAESFLEQAADGIRKLDEIKTGKRRATQQAIAKLEKKHEDLFLQRHEIEAGSHELRSEEARRLDMLRNISASPSLALKKLEGYQPIDPSVDEALASLEKAAEDIAAVEKAVARSAFSGRRSVTFDEAVELVEKLQNTERLEAKLRRGNLSSRDRSLLNEILGADALACLDTIGRVRRELLRKGYLEQGSEGLKLSPRAIRRIGQKALSDIFAHLKRGHPGGHPTVLKGAGQPDIGNTRAYGFGDPFNVHLGKTLMNALLRDAGRIPIDIQPTDFEVYREQRSVDCSNVLLLDLSYTMSQNGKLQTAKKVILALDTLIRTRFPRDTLHLVGFATYARKLKPEDLPSVNLSPGNPFTNIQDGFRLAEKLIARDRGRSRQIILITDGEPTAYCTGGDLHVDYPPTEEIFRETMKEVARLTRKGIVINTFMLDDKPLLVEFVNQMSRLNRGRAFFSTPDRLGEYLLVDYLARRKSMIN